jgi:ferredoxin
VRIRVDFDLCQGHGVCQQEAPAVFAVDEERNLVVVLDPEPPESQRAAVQQAVRYCPTRALRLEE